MTIKNIKKKLSSLYMKLQINRRGYVYKTKKCELKYLFFPNKCSDKLLVVFSGFGKNGEPGRYNYIRKFQNVNMNRLYILDDFSFDKSGAYYLGKGNDFFIEEAVQNLISNIADKQRINKQNIITCGSSKGGTASLYFGLKYGYGEIIAGGPQVFIADYLLASGREETFNYIVGENKEEGKKHLNSLLFNAIKNMNNKMQPNIKIHVGKGDHHYENHVMPLIRCLDEYKLRYELDIANYSNHGDLGVHYAPFALRHLK